MSHTIVIISLLLNGGFVLNAMDATVDTTTQRRMSTRPELALQIGTGSACGCCQVISPVVTPTAKSPKNAFGSTKNVVGNTHVYYDRDYGDVFP
jgi:bacterioferritin-associated ferredoxin